MTARKVQIRVIKMFELIIIGGGGFTKQEHFKADIVCY